MSRCVPYDEHRCQLPTKAHSRGPVMQASDDLAALIRRAEGATPTARRLLQENNRLRRSAERQLAFMWELHVRARDGAQVACYPRITPDRLAAEDS